MHREWFNCWECGRTKANEYGECAYCGGDVVVMIAEAQMIDIDHLERRIKYRDEDEPLLPPSPEEVLALIAEIRRLLGENKMLYQMVDDAIAMAAHRRTGLLGPDRVEHRKCPCGGEPTAWDGVEA